VLTHAFKPQLFALLILQLRCHDVKRCDKLVGTMAVESVLRACEILRTFRAEGELLRLRDVVERTGLPKSTAHRLLRTLQEGGLIEEAGSDQYRSMTRTVERQRRLRIGFGAQTTASTFSQAVTDSVRRAAWRTRSIWLR
jgi:ribose transport system substrate-binding protein